MTKEDLIKLAEEIIQPDENSYSEYDKKRESMVSEMNNYMEARKDINDLVGGSKNIPMLKDDNNNQSKFMNNLFKNYSPKALIDTMCWALSAYTNHNFEIAYFPATLNGWSETMKKNLSEKTYDQLIPVYDFLIAHQASFVELSGVQVK